jgi:hypothetical protein
VALFEERWVSVMESAMAKADKVAKHEVDPESAEDVKTRAAEEEPS